MSWWSDASLSEVKIVLHQLHERKRKNKKRLDWNGEKDHGQQECRHLCGSYTTMDPEVKNIKFAKIEHLKRYVIELWAKEEEDAVKNDEASPMLLVNSQFFDCPLPRPEWCDTSQQWRTEKKLGLTVKRLPIKVL